MKKIIYLSALILLCSYVPGTQTRSANVVRKPDDNIKPDSLVFKTNKLYQELQKLEKL